MIPVCVFAKPHVAGKVKTRLIPVLGSERAAALAAAMFSDVWQTVSSCDGVRPVLATVEHGPFAWTIPEGDIWLQGEGDLGARIERIFARALKTAPATIAIGADSPFLSASHLREAVQRMPTHGAALGACEDGGFYLLGLSRCPAGLFSNLPWSSAETAMALKKRLHEFGFSIFELAPSFDVDTPEDLPRLFSQLGNDPTSAPSTYAWYLQNGFAEW